HVHREHDQTFVLELLRDLVNERRFAHAIRTPSSPELEQNYLAFCGFVGEVLPVHGFGVEARRDLSAIRDAKRRKHAEEQDGEDPYSYNGVFPHHARSLSHSMTLCSSILH